MLLLYILLSNLSFLSLLHRCGEDETLVYNYEENAVQQFSLDAFRFMRESADPVVYLHCAVEACRKGDNSSRCAQGCVEDNGSKRRRRSLVLDSVAQQTVTVGPVYKTDAAPAANGESYWAGVRAYATKQVRSCTNAKWARAWALSTRLARA